MNPYERARRRKVLDVARSMAEAQGKPIPAVFLPELVLTPADREVRR